MSGTLLKNPMLIQQSQDYNLGLFDSMSYAYSCKLGNILRMYYMHPHFLEVGAYNTFSVILVGGKVSSGVWEGTNAGAVRRAALKFTVLSQESTQRQGAGRAPGQHCGE